MSETLDQWLNVCWQEAIRFGVYASMVLQSLMLMLVFLRRSGADGVDDRHECSFVSMYADVGITCRAAGQTGGRAAAHPLLWSWR
jgi:hypothetical protein